MQDCQCGGAPLALDLFRLLITGQPCEPLRADSRNCTINGTIVASATLGAARSLNCTSPCFSIFFSAPAPSPGVARVNNAITHEPGKPSSTMVVGLSVGVVGAIVAIALILLMVCCLLSHRHRTRFNKQCEEIRMQMTLPNASRKRSSRSSSRCIIRDRDSSDRYTAERRVDDNVGRPECVQASDTGESATSPVHDSAYEPSASIRETHPSNGQPSIATRSTDPPPIAPRGAGEGTDPSPIAPRGPKGTTDVHPWPEDLSRDKGHFTSRHLFDRTRCDGVFCAPFAPTTCGITTRNC